MPITRVEAIKRFFSVPEKPVEPHEIMELAKSDRKGYLEIGDACIKALGEILDTGAAQVA